MAHELEFGSDGQAKMFWVGDVPPWHGLGVKLDRPPTIKEAITCAGLDWNVECRQLVMESDGRKVPARATVRSSDGAVLGLVGMVYKPLQNSFAFDWFQPWVDAKLVELETAGCLKGGTHVWVLAKVKAEPTEIVKGDPIVRYVLLSNSHDGSRMVRAGFTGVRVVCWNTVNAAMSSSTSRLLRVRHTQNAEQALDQIRASMDLANKRFEATVEEMRLMARMGVTKDSLAAYVKAVFKPAKPLDTDLSEEEREEAEDKQEEKCERLIGRITPLFEHGRGNDMPGVKGTVWAAYNAVTEYLTWERGASNDNRMTSLWLGDGQAVAQRAFSEARKLAMAMAA